MPPERRARSAATLATATLVGGGIGLLWWSAYDPRPLPLALLVAGHVAVAWLAAAAAARWRPRWFNPASIGLALTLALAVTPAALAPLYRDGFVWGPLALLAEVVAAGAAALLGASLGRALLRGPRRVLATGALAAYLAIPFAVRSALAPTDANDGSLGLAADPPFPTAPVAVIGLDGADWRILRPLLEAGQMPTLEDLIQRGQHGLLRSIDPALSPVVWTSIFTGQPREVHGIETWETADARNRRSAALWDILGAGGLPTLTVNVPGSWPPLPPPGGALISGFPMPGMNPAVARLATGMVLSSQDEDDTVPTVRLERFPGNRYRATLFLEIPLVDPLVGAFSNVFLDVARQKLRFMSRPEVHLEIEWKDGDPVLTGDGIDATVALPRHGFGPWLSVSARGLPVLIRPYVLEATPERLRVYLTPPRLPLWTNAVPLARNLPSGVFDHRAPYIAEPAGIEMHPDRRVGHLLPLLSYAAEANRNALVRRAYARLRPAGLAFVMTLGDRLQHGYLRYHEAGESPAPLPLPETLQQHDPIVEAYRLIDGLLADLLAVLPPEALVLVVSDHGFAHPTVEGPAQHRLEGIWIAAGPMVPSRPEAYELSILDVLPTLLHCLGAAPAADLPGHAAVPLCPAVPTLPPVATYTAARGERTDRRVIDRSREEQIRSLGYVQ